MTTTQTSTTSHTCRGAVFCGFPEHVATRDCPACNPLPAPWTYHPTSRATGAWTRTTDTDLILVYPRLGDLSPSDDAGWTFKTKRLDGSGQTTTTRTFATAADTAEHLETELGL